MHPIRLGRAVAGHVIPHLAARRFYCLVHFALGNGKSFGHDLEVIDERFHLRLHLLPIRKHNLRRVSFDRPARHAFHRLLHDAD